MKAKNNAAGTAEALEPIGVQGASGETLEAVLRAVKNLHLERAQVTLVTDWQDRRERARYAVFVREGEHRVLSADAFGPRYGEAGGKALADLVNALTDRGANNFKESVLSPHEFSQALEYPDEAMIMKITANANPTDPSIYT